MEAEKGPANDATAAGLRLLARMIARAYLKEKGKVPEPGTGVGGGFVAGSRRDPGLGLGKVGSRCRWMEFLRRSGRP